MKQVIALLAAAFVIVQTINLPAQTKCGVSGPPHGPTNFTGTADHKFDYRSHKGTLNHDNFFQVGTKNLGPNPLTINWEGANYFRRGIPPQQDAPGSCENDGNPLNTASGLITSGPNLNFKGPVAQFYAASGRQAARPKGPLDFLVRWEAILESGEKYLAAVSIAATAVSDSSIQYTFTSTGRPIEISWPNVLSAAMLAQVQRQNDRLVRATRLVLNNVEPQRFTLTGDGQTVAAVTAPLAVYVPNGPMLYQDNHRGLALVARDAVR